MARRKSGLSGPSYFTTFQVAKILGVSPPAVVNWVKSGLLHAHRTPGGHRRITRSDLVAFAKAREYPLPPEFGQEPESVRKKALVVDDEATFSEMVREYLDVKGDFDVEVADSGFAAGLTVARFRPDVILMDIMMPGMDGFEVLHMLRSDADMGGVPVVACTAYKDPQVEARIAQEGFDAFVQKPVKLDELVALLTRIVQAEGTRNS